MEETKEGVGNKLGYFVTVEKDVKLYIEDINPTGEKTIVFLHGWPLNYKQFEYQFNVLPSMGYRCIGIDWRGFGQSDKPVGGYDFNRLADDIAMVMSTLKLDHIILAGHSTGGSIALRYMTRYKEYGVSKLVLIDAAAPTGFTQETARNFLTEIHNDRPNMLREITDTFFFQYISKPFSDWFFQMGLDAASWSTAAIVKTLRDEKFDDTEFSMITVPTLIVHGVHDKVIPFSQAEILNNKIKGSKLIPFEYSGHGLFLEERKKFNKELIDFTS